VSENEVCLEEEKGNYRVIILMFVATVRAELLYKTTFINAFNPKLYPVEVVSMMGQV